MNFLTRTRIATRLALGYGVVIALMLLLLGVTLLNLEQVSAANKVMSTVQSERMALAREWKENIAVNSQRALAIGMTSDETVAQRFAEVVKATTQRTTAVSQRYAELETSDEGKAVIARLGETRQGYLAAREAMFKARASADALPVAIAQFQKAIETYLAVASENIQLQQRNQDRLAAAIVAATDNTRNAFIGIVVLAMVAAAVLGWQVAASIIAPLHTLQATARTVAAGDLSQTITGDPHSETGRLMGEMAAMQTSLRSLVTQVRAASDSIGTASLEVAAGNSDLSARTEQAASQLQSTASSMEQITSTVRNSAQVASQANGLAESARSVAQRGGEVVADVVRTMDQINASSRKIGDIIGVIDSIAFQTNILALNAAVEAARAGEQGRGFAVVASEVRALASRSAEAAREIKSLITASMEQVDQGATQVAAAGATMDEILSSVQRVSDLIGEITVASEQQSSGLDQINAAVAELDRMTQQNATLVQQGAAAADSLQQQAAKLNEGVERFRVG